MGSHVRQHYFETWVRISGDPLLLAAALADAQLFADYVIYERAGCWSYAGGALVDVQLNRGGARLRGVDGSETVMPWDGRPLLRVKELLAGVGVASWRAYGWAAFELSYVKDGDASALDGFGDESLLHLVVPRAEVRIEGGYAHLRAVDQGTLGELLTLVSGPAPRRERPARPIDVRAAQQEDFRQAVKTAVAEIGQRELHKVILSRVVEVPFTIDLVGTYVVGRRANNPARSFVVSLNGLDAAGFSPEIVVQVTGNGEVVSQPLAGTRALTPSAAINERLRAELFASAKEVFEHAISVKTGVDELATVCDPDSVRVAEFMTVRERGSVQHLASSVTGHLSPNHQSWDAFGAVFPAVTVSGVPKHAAYAAIRRNESERRDMYGGAVLTVDHTGAMDAALVLRSVFRRDGRTWLRAGAGIVEQSTPEREFEETCEKLDSVARYLVPASASAAV
jgi:anthranilate synthase component 1/salicylate synthetase